MRVFCFVKQKTAYEMHISDWSSDVCSSDLLAGIRHQPLGTTVLADNAQEAVLEHAAAQVGLELLAHILGQRAVFYISEERRVGTECVSTCRSRWSPCH